MSDSPGVPPSANAHELFRGFSFVASSLLDGTNSTNVKISEDADASTRVGRILNCTITKCKERSLNDYEFLEELGKGSYSVCRKCLHKESKKQFAVKVCFIIS